MNSNKHLPSRQQLPVRIALGRKSIGCTASGDRFPLPSGGRITVSEVVPASRRGGGGGGGGGSGGSLTVLSVPPSRLAGRAPPLSEQEVLVSPVYELAFSSNCPQPLRQHRIVALTLPLLRLPLPVSPPTQQLRLVHRPAGSGTRGQVGGSSSAENGRWQSVDIVEEDNKSITCHVATPGAYVVVLSPLAETFQVTPSGGLLNLKLDPIISVRIPKRAFLETADCRLMILPFSEDRLSLARRSHPSQTMDVVTLSPVYSFHFPPVEFKRPITLKLPLPHWLSETDPIDPAGNCVIMYQQQRTAEQSPPWRILDPGNTVKLTKNSISFEAKHLARYCFLSVARGKAQRASLAMPILCDINEAVPGEVLLFARLEQSAWHLCIDCAPQVAIVDRISERVQVRGWQLLQPLAASSSGDGAPVDARRLRQRRTARRDGGDAADGAAAASGQRQRLVQMRNGTAFAVRLAAGGDLALSQEGDSEAGEDSVQEVQVQYHQLLNESPAVFRIAPTQRCRTVAEDFFAYLLEQQDSAAGVHAEEKAALPAETLIFRSQISILDEAGETVSEHELAIDFAAMKTYLGLKPPTPPPSPTPPPPSPPPPTSRHSEAAAGRLDGPGGRYGTGKRIPVLPKLRLRVNELDPAQARLESFQRLTAPKKGLPAPISLRESKVLSVRSLQTLSDQVRQHCLALAVHLSLPESAITGIGFDALSGRTGLSSVAYKVLTHWKRTVPLRDRGGMVAKLADALASIGRQDLAAAVTECDAAGRELMLAASV